MGEGGVIEAEGILKVSGISSMKLSLPDFFLWENVEMLYFCQKKIPQIQILNKRNNLSILNQMLFCVGDLFQESLYLIWFKITFMILQQISVCICFLTGVYSSMGLSLQITIFIFCWKSEERCFGDMKYLERYHLIQQVDI